VTWEGEILLDLERLREGEVQLSEPVVPDLEEELVIEVHHGRHWRRLRDGEWGGWWCGRGGVPWRPHLKLLWAALASGLVTAHAFEVTGNTYL
jgi:hypothetical protein